jgi:hypothetical protein
VAKKAHKKGAKKCTNKKTPKNIWTNYGALNLKDLVYSIYDINQSINQSKFNLSNIFVTK